MEDRAHALAAGIFLLLLGGFLIAAFAWFTAERVPHRPVLLESRGSVTGLNPEANVRYRGIDAGKVDRIAVDAADPRFVKVWISVRTDLPLTQGTTASLGYQGVTGLAFVALDDKGEAPEPLAPDADGVIRIPLAAGLFDQLSDTALQTVARINDITAQLSVLLGDDNIGRIGRTLERIEAAAGGVDETVRALPETLAAVREVLSPENQRRIGATLEHLTQLSASVAGSVDPVVGDLQSVIRQVGQVADRLEILTNSADRGVFDETLPNLNELLVNLVGVSQQLGRLVDDVDRNPQLLLTGRGGGRAGPGEDGFVRPATQGAQP